MYLWSRIVYLRFVFGYTTINGLERIRLRLKINNWNQGLGYSASKHLQYQQDYQVLQYLEKVQNTYLLLAYYPALASNHNRLTPQLPVFLSYVLPLLLTYYKHLSIINSQDSIQHILLSTLRFTQIRLIGLKVTQ